MAAISTRDMTEYLNQVMKTESTLFGLKEARRTAEEAAEREKTSHMPEQPAIKEPQDRSDSILWPREPVYVRELEWDRMVILITAFLAIGGIGLILFSVGFTIVGIVLFALVAILVVVGGLFSDKLKIPDKLALKVPFLLKLQNAFSIYRSHPKAFWLSGLDSVWLQIVTILIHYAYFRAVGIDVDIAIITVFTTIMVVFTMLPISINGIGIRENVQVSLYTGLLGIPADIVLASTLLSYLPLLFQAAQGALVFACLGKNK